MKKTGSKNNSCRITRRADEQGMRPTGRDQPSIKKSTTGISPPVDDPLVHQNGDNPESGTLDLPSNQNTNKTKPKRLKWSKEEYKEVMSAYYKAQLSPT